MRKPSGDEVGVTYSLLEKAKILLPNGEISMFCFCSSKLHINSHTVAYRSEERLDHKKAPHCVIQR